MAQFDIFVSRKKHVQYFIDMQDGILDMLSTRIVAPLVSSAAVRVPMHKINPVIYVKGKEFILLSHLLAAIPVVHLGEYVTSAKMQRDEIISAIDMLFTGI